MITGIWNIAAVHAQIHGSYETTLVVKLIVVVISGIAAALHARARINENPHSPRYLQENLNAVYTFKNPKSYPLSSYSYWIVPRTGTRQPPNFTRAKGNTLSLVVEFALCAGQTHLDSLGYAPLPPNLVAGGLLTAKSIPGHVHIPAHC